MGTSHILHFNRIFSCLNKFKYCWYRFLQLNYVHVDCSFNTTWYCSQRIEMPWVLMMFCCDSILSFSFDLNLLYIFFYKRGIEDSSTWLCRKVAAITLRDVWRRIVWRRYLGDPVRTHVRTWAPGVLWQWIGRRRIRHCQLNYQLFAVRYLLRRLEGQFKISYLDRVMFGVGDE